MMVFLICVNIFEYIKSSVIFQTAAEKEHLRAGEKGTKSTNKLAALRITAIVTLFSENDIVLVNVLPADVAVHLEEHVQLALDRLKCLVLHGSEYVLFKAALCFAVNTLKKAVVIRCDDRRAWENKRKQISRHAFKAFAVKLFFIEDFKQMAV